MKKVLVTGGAGFIGTNLIKQLKVKGLHIVSIDNYSTGTKFIADSQGKELNYEMVDFHSSRPGHDLRYSLSDEKMKKLG